MGTLVVGSIILLLAGAAVRSIWKNKKAGNPCAGCSGCCGKCQTKE